jgi:hypothetical protein
MEIQPADGKILVGGNFTDFNSNSRSGLVRLNSVGTIDTSFIVGTGFGPGGTRVNKVSIQSDGKILVGGNFTDYDGDSNYGLVRLANNGAIDNTFSANLPLTGDSVVMGILPLDGGNILVSGKLNISGGTGQIDTSMIIDTYGNLLQVIGGLYTNSQADNMIYRDTNKIVVGGSFNSITDNNGTYTVGSIVGITINGGSGCYTVTGLECETTASLTATTISGPYDDCPECAGPLPSLTPTMTPTPTPTNAISVGTCDVLYVNNTGVTAYNYSTDTNTPLTIPGFVASPNDIAHTISRLFTIKAQNVYEWSITLSPFTATYITGHTFLSGLIGGIFAKNSTTLISARIFPGLKRIVELNLTTNTEADIFPLESNRVYTYDLLLTTTNKLIILSLLLY